MSRRRPASLAIAAVGTLLGGTGCVVDAPETIEELVTFGFEHYEEEPRYLRATAEALLPLVDDSFDEITDGWRVDNLSADHLLAAGVEVPDDLHILGAMGAADYRHTVDEVLPALIHPDKDAIFDSFLEYEILEETDRVCFLDGSCDRYWYRSSQTVEASILGDATSTVEREYRRIEPEEGPSFLVARTLAPDPIEFTTNIVDIYQQYDLIFIYPYGDAARRSETFWVDALFLDDEIPDYFAVETAARSMRDQAGRVDDYLDTQ